MVFWGVYAICQTYHIYNINIMWTLNPKSENPHSEWQIQAKEYVNLIFVNS